MSATACPECGLTNFYRWEAGNYTERQFFDSESGEQVWDDVQQDVMHTENWFCVNKHEQSVEAQDAIEEAVMNA